MISYKKIGHFGRLGNQLFQFASTYGIARRLGHEVGFPIENITKPVTERFADGKVLDVVFDVPKVFNIPNECLLNLEEVEMQNKVCERFFHFDEELFLTPDNSEIIGYLQSEKYFKHVEQEVRGLLTFRSEILEKAEALFPRVNGSTVSIHIRRGDYVNQQQFHPTCTAEYYLAAASQFTEDSPYFIIFSDDIEYCKDLFAENENILYINNIDPYVDLCLMSMCDHNIIANSSFSWWGAWLNGNENKKVIAPRNWFGPAYNHYIVDDLFCENWKTI